MRSRKRPQGQTEAERWIETYCILFPLDVESMIPSPCEQYLDLWILKELTIGTQSTMTNSPS